MLLSTTLLLLPLIPLAFWIWMFWDMVHNDDIPQNVRPVWFLAFVFGSVVVAVYYYFTEYQKKR